MDGEGAVEGPVVSYLASGKGVMAWIERTGAAQSVRYVRLDARGQATGAVVTVGATGEAERGEPNVAILGSERVAVAWSQEGSDWPARQVRYAFFEADDTPLVVDATVFEDADTGQVQPQIVRSLSEAFAMVWLGADHADELGLLRRIRLDADGLLNGRMDNLVPTSAALARRPVARSTEDGEAVICWLGGVGRAFAARFGPFTALVGDVQEDIYSQHAAVQVTCDLATSGAYVVAQVIKEPYEAAQIRIREYDENGGFARDVSPAEPLEDAAPRQLDLATLPGGGAWTLALRFDDPGDALLVLSSADDRRWRCPVRGAAAIHSVSLGRSTGGVVAGLAVQEGASLAVGTALLAPEAW